MSAPPADSSARVIASQGLREPGMPSDCPAGWRTGPPDFVGVGAQRSGTTRWFDLITAHSEVAAPLATRKELHYFDRFYAGGFTVSDAAAYSDYFPRPAGAITGEWTPNYMAVPYAIGMLAAAAPAARLLVLLRDPVERYLSGLQRHRRMALAAGEPLSATAPLEAFAHGLYHCQLARLLNHFPRAQVLILQYERCVCEPRSELRRTYEFLGLCDTSTGSEAELDLDAHPNHQAEKLQLHGDVRGALVQAYIPEVKRLARDYPEIDLSLWPNFSGARNA